MKYIMDEGVKKKPPNGFDTKSRIHHTRKDTIARLVSTKARSLVQSSQIASTKGKFWKGSSRCHSGEPIHEEKVKQLCC